MSVKDSEFITTLKSRSEQSPDFPEFKLTTDPVVFIYDSFRFGTLENKEVLSEANYLGTGITVDDSFVMTKGYVQNKKYANQSGIYREHIFCFQEKTRDFTGVIRGDLFQVSPSTILYLDKMYHTGNLSKRQLHKVIFEHQPKGKLATLFNQNVGDAFIWVWDDARMDNVCYHQNDIPRKLVFEGKKHGLRPWEKPYLEFTNLAIDIAHMVETEDSLNLLGENWEQEHSYGGVSSH